MKNLFRKKEVISMKKFFETIKPQYTILQVIPDISIRNYNSENIAKSIDCMYRSFTKRIKKDRKHKKIIYKEPFKTSFMIDINKKNVNFYFICPSQYANFIKEKIIETWNKAAIKKVENIPNFSDGCLKYQLHYQKEDALSFKTDKKLNQPLNNILSVINIMEDKDRVGILYNFMPCSQKPWRDEYDEIIEKYNTGIPIDKIHGKSYITKLILTTVFSVINDIMGILVDILGTLSSNEDSNTSAAETAVTSLQKLITDNKRKLNRDTLNKKDSIILKTQMLVFSDSTNEIRKENNANVVCEAYKVLDGDNKLVYEKLKNGTMVYYTDFKAKGVVENKLSTSECKHLLELPGKTLLTEYNNIEKINTLENPVPEVLQTGNIRLGKVTYRGKQFNAYLPNNYDKANLPLCLLSAQGGGKTTLMCNMVMDAIKNNEGCGVIDFIKNCELANAIKSVTPPGKLVEIDCSDINNLQGFGYNEITLKGNTDIEKLDMANLQAQQTIAFINAINVDDESRGLTSQMKRLLRAAANVTYFTGRQNIGDVIECLENYRVRMEYVKQVKASEDASKILRTEILTLEDINELDKKGNIIGTKGGIALKGILDRIDDLQQDMRTKIMFNKDCSSNINFVECMNQGKIILIKMPEDIFFSVAVKDMLTTFFCTKFILAIKLRSKQGKPKRFNMVIDELTQCPGAQALIKQTLSQTRKFGGKYILALHYLNQLKHDLDKELKGAGSSFILLQGSDKVNYNEFKDELGEYQLEDLLNLKQFSAINLLKTNNGWTKFITDLPPEPLQLKKLRDMEVQL